MKRVAGLLIGGWLSVSGGCNQPPPSVSAPIQDITSQTPTTRSQAEQTPPQPVLASPATAPTSAPAVADSPIVARINGQIITRDEFLRPLIEAHGLQILMGLVQLDMAKQQAADAHVTVTPEDIRAEEDLSLERMFKDSDPQLTDEMTEAENKGDLSKAQELRKQIRSDRQALLAQFLEKQNYSRTEFELKVQINAYLRKAADRMLTGKVTDEMLENEFNVEYGQTADVAFIQVANNLDAQTAMRRIRAGEDFGKVAREMSQHKTTAELGGKLEGISLQSQGIPESFKKLAFSLHEGEVGDVLNLQNNYYIIKLLQKHAPKAVKFEKVKDSLRKSMYERLAQATMEQLSSLLGKESAAKLQIVDPELRRDYQALQTKQDAAAQDRQKMENDWKKNRLAHRIAEIQAANTRPSTTAPAASAPAAEAPASAPAAAAAPATQP